MAASESFHKPEVSIIIVNYNTASLIRDCIASIIDKVRSITYEIIVVDNDSKDDVVGVVNDFDNPRFRCICLDKNIGFGRANNEGFKVSKGEYIFCLNPDTILVNDAIGILVNFLRTHPSAGICGANLIGWNDEPVLSFRRRLPGIIWEINELLNHIPDKIIHGRNRRYNYTDHPIKVGYIMGADMMMRREVYEKTGGFSPEFFMYFEETDLCYKARNLGWEIYSVPEAIIRHLEGGSYDTSENIVNYQRIERSEKSRIIYYLKNCRGYKRLISNWIYKMFLLSRASLIKEGVKKESYKFRYFLLGQDCRNEIKG